MVDDDDNETGMTPEERRRWRVRRGLPVRPIAAKKLRAEARKKLTRKKRLRRKRNGSVQRRKVRPDDGRRAWVKRMKAKGNWPPPSRESKLAATILQSMASQPSLPPPPPIRPGSLALKPRVSDPRMTAVRESFSKGRARVIIEKRGDLSEPLPQPLNAVPADKV